jgi:hypothetical protein
MNQWSQEILKRMASLNLPAAREAEIVEEVAQHLEDRCGELVAGGATEEQARRMALEELSDEDLLARGLRQVEQEVRQEPLVPGAGGAGNFLASMWQDIRFGLRTTFKDRGFVVASVLALALGIGSCTAIFSVIDNVLLEPFPYLDSHRIFGIEIHDTAAAEGDYRNYFSVLEFLDYQEQNHIFDRTIGIWEETVLLDSSRALELLETDRVTGNTFEFLGVAPLLGRGILPSDALPGAPPVFVLNYRVWVKRRALILLLAFVTSETQSRVARQRGKSVMIQLRRTSCQSVLFSC